MQFLSSLAGGGAAGGAAGAASTAGTTAGATSALGAGGGGSILGNLFGGAGNQMVGPMQPNLGAGPASSFLGGALEGGFGLPQGVINVGAGGVPRLMGSLVGSLGAGRGVGGVLPSQGSQPQNPLAMQYPALQRLLTV